MEGNLINGPQNIENSEKSYMNVNATKKKEKKNSAAYRVEFQRTRFQWKIACFPLSWCDEIANV